MMTPRRPDSKKWTHFPSDLLMQIEEATQEFFAEEFKKQLTETQFIVEGQIFPQEVLLRLGLSQKNTLKQPNFEISFDIGDNKDEVWQRLRIALDFLQGVMVDYLSGKTASSEEESTELELPLSWKKVNFKNDTFFFQYSTTNSKLEALADQLLGINEKSLVGENDSIEDDAFELADIESEEVLAHLKDKNHLH
ncbi:MAG: hypothetical protein L6Q37_07525 [Bdellovibrionaceae bacterium]|nr:hypothetical protein [Pseudobdellovibrionaceae bacterium]NUM57718.1 hypothetical protein [Pseudobdellovibrionaceae bacterium]